MKELQVITATQKPELHKFLSYWKEVKGKAEILVLFEQHLPYDEEEKQISDNINARIIKQRTTLPIVNCMPQAWNRNELLTYADAKYVLFHDDWQIPAPDLVNEHLRYLRKGYYVCGRIIFRDKTDRYDVEIDHRNAGALRKCTYSWFWGCNSSCPLEDVLAVNGFDNYFNGGTSGEDCDLGMRMQRYSRHQFLYNPKAITKHISHVHLDTEKSRMKRAGRIAGCPHNLSPFEYIPEGGHFGDWNLMKSEQFEFFFHGGFKYYKCKYCGQVGITDSYAPWIYNRNHNIARCSWGMEEVKILLEEAHKNERSGSSYHNQEA